MKYKLKRNVTKNEFHWLDRDFLKGEIVYRYNGSTYGCCTRNGVACTLGKEKIPFFELPKDALIEINPI